MMFLLRRRRDVAVLAGELSATAGATKLDASARIQSICSFGRKRAGCGLLPYGRADGHSVVRKGAAAQNAVPSKTEFGAASQKMLDARALPAGAENGKTTP